MNMANTYETRTIINEFYSCRNLNIIKLLEYRRLIPVRERANKQVLDRSERNIIVHVAE